jgi:putative FmdB family regulatory protein
MPIYEYQCTACGFQKEVLQKISDEPLKICPECGKETMQKMVTAAAFRLKGSGWYETDFKKDNKKNVAESSTDSKGKKPAESKATAEKKPTVASAGSTTTTKKSSKT